MSASAPSAPVTSLPPELRDALATVDDFSFSYAQPAFYALLRHVASRAGESSASDPALRIDNWTQLLERSADYRGHSVEVSGIVGRNTSWQHISPDYAALGRISELQIYRDDQPIVVKALLVGDASDIPIGALVTIQGRFLMIQRYYSEAKRERQAALLVGVGPTRVASARPAAPAARAPTGGAGIGFAAALGLLVAWVLLRRATVARSRSPYELTASGPAPMNLARDLDDWSARESVEPPRSTSGPRSAEPQ